MTFLMSQLFSPEQRERLRALALRTPGFTMADASAALGVSRATLYRLVPRRSELLAALGVVGVDEAGDDHAPARILAALEATIGDVGPTGVSVEGVAARAGVSPATVYRHFPDRAALWRGLMAKKSVRHSAHWHLDPAGDLHSAPDALAAFTLEVLAALHEGRALFAVLLAAPPALRAELAALRVAEGGTTATLAAFLRALQVRGAVADDVDVDLAAAGYVAQLVGLAVVFPLLGAAAPTPGEESRPRDPVVVARAAAQTLWRGVAR